MQGMNLREKVFLENFLPYFSVRVIIIESLHGKNELINYLANRFKVKVKGEFQSAYTQMLWDASVM